MSSEQLIFVIHTRQYSGNFERQLCAYITGQVGECGVGNKEATLFTEDVGEDMSEAFEEIIGSNADDNGCYRPAEIYPTPGRWNNGVGQHFNVIADTPEKRWPAYESVAIYFNDMPTSEMIELMKERTYEYAKSNDLTVIGFEMIREVTSKTSTSISI